MMKTMYISLVLLIVLISRIDDVNAGVRTDKGPGNASAEPPCNGPGAEGQVYPYGAEWTHSNGYKCQCYAHGISNCDHIPSDDN